MTDNTKFDTSIKPYRPSWWLMPVEWIGSIPLLLGARAKVEKVDVSNAVNLENMTEEEVIELQGNLLESPLYKFLEEEGILDELGMGDPTVDPIVDPIVDPTVDPTVDPIGSQTTTADNVLKGYGHEVTFSTIPEFETSEYNTDTIKFFNSTDYLTSVLSWNTIDEELKFYEEYYAENDGVYENVVISQRETKTVGDKTFTVLKITYDFLGDKNTDTIYCYQMDDEYLYIVEYEVEGEETYDITPFLTINVTEIEE